MTTKGYDEIYAEVQWEILQREGLLVTDSAQGGGVTASDSELLRRYTDEGDRSRYNDIAEIMTRENARRQEQHNKRRK